MQVAEGVKGFTHREPWGVVAGIIPWNYPIVLTSWFMFPALLGGEFGSDQTRGRHAALGALHRQTRRGSRLPAGRDQRAARTRRNHRACDRGESRRAVYFLHRFPGSRAGDSSRLRSARHADETRNGRQRGCDCSGRCRPRTRRPHDRPLHQPALRPDLLHDSPRVCGQENRGRFHRCPAVVFQRTEDRLSSRRRHPIGSRRQSHAAGTDSQGPTGNGAAGRRSRCWPAAWRKSQGERDFM